MTRPLALARVPTPPEAEIQRASQSPPARTCGGCEPVAEWQHVFGLTSWPPGARRRTREPKRRAAGRAGKTARREHRRQSRSFACRLSPFPVERRGEARLGPQLRSPQEEEQGNQPGQQPCRTRLLKCQTAPPHSVECPSLCPSSFGVLILGTKGWA